MIWWNYSLVLWSLISSVHRIWKCEKPRQHTSQIMNHVCRPYFWFRVRFSRQCEYGPFLPVIKRNPFSLYDIISYNNSLSDIIFLLCDIKFLCRCSLLRLPPIWSTSHTITPKIKMVANLDDWKWNWRDSMILAL